MILSAQEFTLSPGDRIGEFKVIAPIGSGSYGEVYLVEDELGKKQALKLLKEKADHRCAEREINGIKAIRERIRYAEGLPLIYNVGKYDGKVYYTMDAADDFNSNGQYAADTLSARLAVNGPLSALETLRLARDILRVLAVLHGKGLAHRDVKPSNIIYFRGRPMLSDLGLVTSAEKPSLVGTPDFMPQEGYGATLSLHNEQNNDLYALGKVIYCAFTGLHPKDYPLLPTNYSIKELTIIRKIYETACNSLANQRFSSIADFSDSVEQGILKLEAQPLASLKKTLLCAICLLVALLIAFGAYLATVRSKNRVISPKPSPESAGEFTDKRKTPPLVNEENGIEPDSKRVSPGMEMPRNSNLDERPPLANAQERSKKNQQEKSSRPESAEKTASEASFSHKRKFPANVPINKNTERPTATGRIPTDSSLFD